MAFQDISAYTADEKAKVKADLVELSALIDTTVAHHLAVDGLETDEAIALTRHKAVITARIAQLDA